MNSVNIKKSMRFINGIVLLIVFGASATSQAWEIDFSRRQLDFQKVKDRNYLPDRAPASEKEKKEDEPLNKVFDALEPAQDIVILHTEKGFIPESLNLRKGKTYHIHVVNVNAKEKNVSFVMDAFSEHHNTVFGLEKAFTVTPQVQGVFSYQCPETSQQGKLLVIGDERKPAGE